MKMQMHIFLKYFIAHSIAQPDHYYRVFILIGKNVGHIQSTASFGPHIDWLKKFQVVNLNKCI